MPINKPQSGDNLYVVTYGTRKVQVYAPCPFDAKERAAVSLGLSRNKPHKMEVVNATSEEARQDMKVLRT